MTRWITSTPTTNTTHRKRISAPGEGLELFEGIERSTRGAILLPWQAHSTAQHHKIACVYRGGEEERERQMTKLRLEEAEDWRASTDSENEGC